MIQKQSSNLTLIDKHNLRAGSTSQLASHSFRIGHINIRSLRHKVHEVSILITQSSLSVLAVSESWLGCADGNDFLAVDGYVLFRRDRSATGQGGGVCIYVKEVFHASVEEQYSHADIELLWIRIPATKHSHSFLIGCICGLLGSSGVYIGGSRGQGACAPWGHKCRPSSARRKLAFSTLTSLFLFHFVFVISSQHQHVLVGAFLHVSTSFSPTRIEFTLVK